MQNLWTETTKRMVAVVGVIAVLILVYLARVTLTSLLIGAVIAYVLFPIVDWLQHRLRFPRTLATITVYLLMLLSIAAVPILLVPIVLEQVRALDLNWSDLLTQGRDWLVQTLQDWRVIHLPAGLAIDLSSLVDPALQGLTLPGILPDLPSPTTWIPRLFGGVATVASSVTSATVTLLLTLVYSFYLVKEAPDWGRRLKHFIPEAYQAEVGELSQRLSNVWSSFFRGQLLLCLAIGSISFLALTIMGIPGAVPLALLAGLMEVIPNIGPLIALGPAVAVALIQGSSIIPWSHGWVALLVLGVYLLIQQVENNLLVPRIIGGSVDLPALVVLIGVIIGAGNAGVLGAFLAAPVLATIKILALYAYDKVLDHPPFSKENALPQKRKKEGATQGTEETAAKAAETPKSGEQSAGVDVPKEQSEADDEAAPN
ncbi:MAG: AI-2E family transporter [Chloroflexia bacterium]|nr:AI-2E family transporter [Chloroflexia bacterium]